MFRRGGYRIMYKATEKFKELDDSNAYQGLTKDQYYQLMNGKSVDVKDMPKKLLDGKYVESSKAKKSKES